MQQTYPVSVERLQARLQWAESLLELKELLTSTLDVAEVYRRAARAFVENFEISRCALSSWEQEANTLTTQAEFTSDALAEGDLAFTQAIEVFDLDDFPGSRQLLQDNQAVIRIAEDPNLEPTEKQIMQSLGMAYALEVPLVYRGATVGLVELFRADTLHIFNNEEVQFAQAMAVQVAGALHNAQITTEANRRAAELSMLNRLSEAFSSAPTLAAVFQSAYLDITSLFEITRFTIFLLEETELQVAYCVDNEMDVVPEKRPFFPNEPHLLQTIVDNPQLVLIRDNQPNPIPTLPETITGTWLGLPLIVAKNLIGILILENEYDNTIFTQRNLSLLRTLVGPLATTISRLIQFEALQTALARQSEQRLQLQTAAAVAAATTDILELKELIQQAVDLIKEQFNLYYVGLFLIDTNTNFAVLRAGTGEAGQVQVAQAHQLHVGGRSLIGGATFDANPRITQDVLLDKEWRPNPHLPETRSELALPLRVRGRIIGALTVQSSKPNHFTDDLIETLLTMADQMSVAIENAQLIAEVQGRAERQRRLNQLSTLLHNSSDAETIIEIGLKALSEHLGNRDVTLKIGR